MDRSIDVMYSSVVEESELTVPAPDVAVPAGPVVPMTAPARPIPRWVALVEVIAVSSLPTQVLIATVLMFGTNIAPFENGELSLEFLAIVMLFDTALIALLIRVFLELSGEDSRTVFIGAAAGVGRNMARPGARARDGGAGHGRRARLARRSRRGCTP